MARITSIFILILFAFAGQASPVARKVEALLKQDILARAAWALQQQPETVTATACERSAGGRHDFYSEGDYWWPNPQDPDGPYIQRDGQTNPNNFTAHRKAMIRFSQVIGYLGSAYSITRDENYVRHSLKHLHAWFADTATRMNPSLLYAQAIKGRVTGRGVGIIDMIQMMEVAQGVRVMEPSSAMDQALLQQIKQWFADYLQWVTTHQYGIDERDAKNNHATCWVMQVAVFASFTGNNALLDDCRIRFKTILLPSQMDAQGSFPLELKRTKPYGYSLFNLDAMTTICQVLSTRQDDLWAFRLDDGRTIKKAIDFLYPFVDNKASWPYARDVMYWEEWPVAHPFLIFGYQRFGEKHWWNTWQALAHFPETAEVIRNLPVRNPLLWLPEKS